MTTAAAHIITAEAESLGDPAILIMTPDEGMGAELIERHALGVDQLGGALDYLRDSTPWGYTGDPVQVATGYWVVDVDRSA